MTCRNINPTKDNFIQALSVKEILDELEICKDDYHRALPISANEDLELPLKRQPNFCSVNYYLSIRSKAWLANMNKQLVLMSIRQ